MPIDFFQGLLEVPHKLGKGAGSLLPPPPPSLLQPLTVQLDVQPEWG